MIKETYNYILHKVHNMDEFRILQQNLFDNGYKWMNDKEIWEEKKFSSFIQFPFYVSNLSWKKDKDISKNLRMRRSFNEYENNILFIDTNEKLFNIKQLRLNKLNTLEKEDK